MRKWNDEECKDAAEKEARNGGGAIIWALSSVKHSTAPRVPLPLLSHYQEKLTLNTWNVAHGKSFA